MGKGNKHRKRGDKDNPKNGGNDMSNGLGNGGGNSGQQLPPDDPLAEKRSTVKVAVEEFQKLIDGDTNDRNKHPGIQDAVAYQKLLEAVTGDWLQEETLDFLEATLLPGLTEVAHVLMNLEYENNTQKLTIAQTVYLSDNRFRIMNERGDELKQLRREVEGKANELQALQIQFDEQGTHLAAANRLVDELQIKIGELTPKAEQLPAANAKVAELEGDKQRLQGQVTLLTTQRENQDLVLAQANVFIRQAKGLSPA